MRPLTNIRPKPLLDVNGASLLQRQVRKLVSSGVCDIIINTAYLGHMIEEDLGDGGEFGARIQYSREPEPLETGGALLYARDLIGNEPIVLVNGDVWSDIDIAALAGKAKRDEILRAGGHLILVPNPPFNANGDFSISQGILQPADLEAATYTFSGVSLLCPELIYDYPSRRRAFPLKEALDWGIAHRRLSAQVHWGYWLDVGTPERLDALREHLKRR